MNKDKFFIYAGLPKSGSTWLYRILAKHPEVEMPIIKEVCYFYFKQEFGKITFWRKLFDNHWVFSYLRRVITNKAKYKTKLFLKGEIGGLIYCKSIIYTIIIFLKEWNNNWYVNLFPKDKWSGDISPVYRDLSEKSIEKVKKINPKTKIIIGLCEPIDREWSHTKMEILKLQGKKSILELAPKALSDRLHDKSFFERSNYVDFVDRWRKYFDDEQILIYYYDELKENPQKLYNKICDFLGLKKVEIKNINKVINKGVGEEIPEEYYKILVNTRQKYVEDFAEKYPNNFSIKWKNSIKDVE